jgi:uncharacterized membrane protein YcaP (DUF421 family)
MHDPTFLLAASLGHNLFHLNISVGEKVLRSLGVFVFLVVALRFGGKRELGQLNVLDFAVLLLASNALQNAMIGNDNTLIGGLIGASVLFAANYVFVRLTFHNRMARRVFEGEPRVLLRDGKPDIRALDHEAISKTELLSAVLERGFADFSEVGLVVLETNGHMAVLGPQAATRWQRDSESGKRR